MYLLKGNLEAVRSLLQSMRSSVKRRDIFEVPRIECGQPNLTIPCLDVEYRWSFTFNMIRKAHKAHLVLKTAENHIE